MNLLSSFMSLKVRVHHPLQQGLRLKTTFLMSTFALYECIVHYNKD